MKGDEVMAKYQVEVYLGQGEWEHRELEDSFKGMTFFIQTNKNEEEIIEDMEGIFPGCDVHCGACDFEINEFDEKVYMVPLFSDSYVVAFFKDNIDDAWTYGEYLLKWADIEPIKVYKVTSEYELWG